MNTDPAWSMKTDVPLHDHLRRRACKARFVQASPTTGAGKVLRRGLRDPV